MISRSDILSICVTFHSSDKTWSEIAFHTIIGFINFMKHANVLQSYMLSVYMIYHRGFMFHSEITLYPFSSSVETVIAVRLNCQFFILWNICSLSSHKSQEVLDHQQYYQELLHVHSAYEYGVFPHPYICNHRRCSHISFFRCICAFREGLWWVLDWNWLQELEFMKLCMQCLRSPFNSVSLELIYSDFVSGSVSFIYRFSHSN